VRMVVAGMAIFRKMGTAAGTGEKWSRDTAEGCAAA